MTMESAPLMEQRWFTPRELAEKLGVSVRTLDDWRLKGTAHSVSRSVTGR